MVGMSKSIVIKYMLVETRTTQQRVTISTWQSIYNMDRQWFSQFDVIIGDEAHQFKSKSLIGIMSKLKDTKYRYGFTGTLSGSQTHKWVLEGLFGPSYKVTQTSDLQSKGQLAKLNIKILLIKHPAIPFDDYREEMNYIIEHDKRNAFIKNLSLSLDGNTLVLYSRVESHGEPLYNLINDSVKSGRKVFYVHGGVDGEEREEVRSIVDRENNAIIVASYGPSQLELTLRTFIM